VAHPCHEFPRIRARIGGELVAGRAQVVNVDAFQADRAGRDASASLRPWGPRSARTRPWLLGRLLINQPIATTARVEAVKLTHLLARASPGRKSYSAVRSRQAAANRMILWPVPSTRAQPTRAEPLSVQASSSRNLTSTPGSTTRHLSGEGPRPITSVTAEAEGAGR
jgi:hypothetical protein